MKFIYQLVFVLIVTNTVSSVSLKTRGPSAGSKKRVKVKLELFDAYHPYDYNTTQSKVVYQLANITDQNIQLMGTRKQMNKNVLNKSKFLKNNNLPVKFEYLNYLSLFYYPNAISGSAFSNKGENMQTGQFHEFNEEEDQDDQDGESNSDEDQANSQENA